MLGILLILTLFYDPSTSLLPYDTNFLHPSTNSGLHPAILRNDITSPGGTTAAALYAAEKGGFRLEKSPTHFLRAFNLHSPPPISIFIVPFCITRVRTIMSDAIWAAYKRSREMGKKDTEVGPFGFRV